MRIPLWATLLFYLAILVLGVLLFPTDREMGKVLYRGNMFTRARGYLEKHQTEEPLDTLSSKRYLKSLEYLLEFDELEQAGEKLIQLNPDDDQMHKYLAQYYENQMQQTETIRHLQEVVRLNPEEKEAYEKLETQLRLTQDYDSLLALYELQLDRGKVSQELYRELGRLYSAKENLTGAMRIYHRLIAEC